MHIEAMAISAMTVTDDEKFMREAFTVAIENGSDPSRSPIA